MSKTALAAAVVYAIVLTGCGGAKPTPVKTDLVEGIVTLDGAPVANATVTFVPVQEGTGASATGTTDAAGKYTLTAVGKIGAQIGAGTLPGEYFVAVQKDEIPDLENLDDKNRESGGGGPSDQEIKVTHVVPPQFNDAKKSGIKVTVNAGPNNIPIDLMSK